MQALTFDVTLSEQHYVSKGKSFPKHFGVVVVVVVLGGEGACVYRCQCKTARAQTFPIVMDFMKKARALVSRLLDFLSLSQ